MHQQKLQAKMNDYFRFAFVLLALTGFMAVGLIIPDAGLSTGQYPVFIALIIGSLVTSVYFHAKAIRLRSKINKDESEHL
ncbi:YrhC family protein [Texcoconibacillus texcoconensis]|uniref:YrhC-like protein n=1 Tax=Texcoconibacillus texcoconensis TaxID=1095777 RepID=A0A840QRT4_9BACI|nr:YrhC family protein [Texcoconibacillus texcoconensis]MBB5174021.1 hypothetical protein [Texcoconibacillus texcoconensis]